MYYMIYATDKPNSLKQRQHARPDHILRLEALAKAGQLLTAGPLPNIDQEDPKEYGFSGSLIIAAFDSLHAAQEWANNDPYLLTGVYETVTVKPYKQVF